MPVIFCILHISVFIQQSLNSYIFIHTFTITAAKTYKLVGTVAKHLLSQINMHLVHIYSITAPYHFFQTYDIQHIGLNITKLKMRKNPYELSIMVLQIQYRNRQAIFSSMVNIYTCPDIKPPLIFKPDILF